MKENLPFLGLAKFGFFSGIAVSTGLGEALGEHVSLYK
jgi:hypothetical protein|tara:strand:- start:393 stop:506 length:114 start_codon:yes stop_codon:yes gene_type:complete